MVWNFKGKILIQGINQPKAIFYLQESNLDHHHIIAGIGDEYISENIENIPVFDLVKEAITSYPTIKTTIIFSDSYNVLDAGYEAMEAGIKQIIINTEKIPPLDLLKLFQKAKKEKVKVLGSSQSGIIIPEKLCLGVRNYNLYQRGNIGIINYGESIISEELSLFLQSNNLGESIIINVGNGDFMEIDWNLWLSQLDEDESTKFILISISNFLRINKEEFIKALTQVKNKQVIIYLLDQNNLKSVINNGQAKIITDQIPQHLNRVFSLTSITEILSEKGIIVTNKHQEILKFINLN